MPQVVRIAIVVVSLVAVVPKSAFANGIDMVQTSGRPGDVVSVTGHFWLTCCPPNTPVEHVRLFIIDGDDRIELFDVSADTEGVIAARFMVPNLAPGRYLLEACAGLSEEEGPCLPEGRFTVLPGSFVTDSASADEGALDADSETVVEWSLPLALGVVGLIVGAALMVRYRRSRNH